MKRRRFLKAVLGAAAAIVVPVPLAPPAKVFGISKEADALWKVQTVGEKDWGTGIMEVRTIIDPIVYADLIGDKEGLRTAIKLKYGGTYGGKSRP